jgi:hypothetical protein
MKFRLVGVLALALLSVACNQFKGISERQADSQHLSCPPDQFPAGDIVTCTPCDLPPIDYNNNPTAPYDDLLQKKLKEQAENEGYCTKGSGSSPFPFLTLGA